MRTLTLGCLLSVLAAASACGGSSGGGTTPLTAATYVGTWTGTWTNTTFNSNGPASIVVAQNGSTFTFTVDLGGGVFGGGDPPAEQFTGTITANSATLNTANSGVYGTLTATLNGNGTFTIAGSAIPGAVNTFALTGTWGASQINCNVTITFDAGGNNASGNATLTKQ